MAALPGVSFQMRLWLEKEGGFSLGQGMVKLLMLVAEHGSLNGAAKEMGMSYRRAWGRLKRHEEALGQALLYKPGGNKGGYRLTDLGQELVDGYVRWLQEVQAFALRSAEDCFGAPIPSSKNKDAPIED